MNRWARHFDNCISCHQTDTEHMAKGLCQRCYSAQYLEANEKRVKQQKHEWYLRSGGIEWARVQREQRNYGGKREAVLKRDGYKCQTCGSVIRLLVHHKDGNGRRNKAPNNDMNNLITLCQACHINLHRPELLAARAIKSASKMWCDKLKLACCTKCHRWDRRHAALGLCVTCYSNFNQKKYRKAAQTQRKLMNN